MDHAYHTTDHAMKNVLKDSIIVMDIVMIKTIAAMVFVQKAGNHAEEKEITAVHTNPLQTVSLNLVGIDVSIDMKLVMEPVQTGWMFVLVNGSH